MRRREQLEFKALKRVILVVGILFIPGVPVSVVMLKKYITGIEYPLSYRIMAPSVEITVSVLSVVLMFSVPQLKNIIWKSSRPNQVSPQSRNIIASLEMGGNIA